MEEKNFLSVFNKLQISANVKTGLKNAIVNSIKVDRASLKAEVFLISNVVVNQECIKDFEKDMFRNFPFLNEVNINLKYDFGELSLDKKIDKIWDTIKKMVSEDSPICYTMIKDAVYILDGNRLEIKLNQKGSFIFKAKGMDIKIAKFIKDRLLEDIFILFVDGNGYYKPKEKEDILYLKPKKETLEDNKSIEIERKSPTITFEKPKTVYKKVKNPTLKVKEDIKEEIVSIEGHLNEGEKITIEGKIILVEKTETRAGKLVVRIDITDMTNSISFKIFTTNEEFDNEYKSIVAKGNFVKIKGDITYDEYSKELCLKPREIALAKAKELKKDEAKEKRVELHLHTQMSKMDGVSSVKDIVKRASDWGHKAIAITDHGVVQAFPDAMDIARKLGIKVLYGVEAYLVDDLANVAENSKNQNLNSSFVVFDLETTGLNKEINKIIEIGAVKIQNGDIVDRYSTFINPNEKLSEEIINLTNITDDMLEGARLEDEVLSEFFEFFKDSVLVAHNANFDVGFIKNWARKHNIEFNFTFVDTVGLSRTLFPNEINHRLDTICKRLNVELESHHRAVDDAEATAHIFLKFKEILEKEYQVSTLDMVNELANKNIEVKKLRPNHAIILAKNQKGLRNLYELISKSNLDYFYRDPRIPKSEFLKLRDGLIIGTACSDGEFYNAILSGADEDEIEKLINFYDYLEIQPIANNRYLIDNEKISNINNDEDLENINRKIVAYGQKYNKLVVATCDVHFLDKEDSYFRKIIMDSKGFKDCDNQPPLYFRTTEEMLEEFNYLGDDKSYEVVVTNTNKIADMIDNILPIPDGTFPPEIEGSDIELRQITTKRAKQIYGDPLPKIVEARLERELDSIIKNGFAVLYIIAQKIVWNSNDNGYIVGSRGSVGSSFAATMAGITEVNPLSPHYFCKNCKYSDFDSEDVKAYAGNSGWDLPDKICPICGNNLSKDGHDIPFETFLGFEGDKEPDIDLNFSGEFQARAHQYTEELFGKDFVFKAGTIGTLADKTAYGYVKKYAERRNIVMTNAETTRLASGCVGIKKTTGQHPGGLMVVPSNKSIYDFCPIQHPADDASSNVITTHFDYHSISGRILKLDLLGHDVPTILRMLKDFTGFDPLDTPMDDKATMSLFTSPKALGVEENDINCKTGSLGLPEFGTPFVIQMLIDTQPNSFSDLVKISGLSHGTDVWFNNAQDLIRDNIATLKEVIPTRDDIMVYLILKGVENKLAFTIMESVRKGKGLTKEFEEAMKEKGVPDWYIKSCKTIKYMFPKGHAVAYVTNAFRMGYFKINYPEAFYASLFSVKAEDFDYDSMCFGLTKVERAIQEIEVLGKQASTKEKNKLVVLELVREMYKRGIKFVELDLYKSKGFKFDITEDGLLPPICSVQGLGENATKMIVKERENGEFYTIENLVERTKISKTVVDILRKNGVLKGIPETNQLSLF